MACKEYLKLCYEAQNKKLKLMKKQEKQIVEIYKELYLETSKKIDKLDSNSLGARYTKVMKGIFEQEIRKANIKVKKLILKNAETSSSLSNNVQLDFFNMLNEKYGCEVLWVNADNKMAIHTYEKNGYSISKPTMYLMERSVQNE